MTGRRTFVDSPRAIASARRFVEQQLHGASRDVIDVATLLVSELATNAVRHAATSFQVHVSQDSHSIRVAVTDSGAGNPRVEPIDPTASGGRGLQIVEMLATSWGIEHELDTKTVWFVIPNPARTTGEIRA